MNPTHRRSCGCDAGLEMVLGLVIPLVGEIIDAEVEVYPVAQLFRYRQIQDIQAGGANRGIKSIEAIIANVPIAKRGEKTLPSRKSHAGVRNAVRCSIHVHTR